MDVLNEGLLHVLDKLGAITVVLLIAWMVITDKLVWHTRLERAEARAERWERVALEALTTGAQAGVKAAEVAANVVTALPDPARNNNLGAKQKSEEV